MADRAYYAHPVASFSACQCAQTLADDLVQNVYPAFAGIGSHDGQWSAHQYRVVALDVYKIAGHGVRRTLGSVKPRYELLSGKGADLNYFCVFDKQGPAVLLSFICR